MINEICIGLIWAIGICTLYRLDVAIHDFREAWCNGSERI